MFADGYFTEKTVNGLFSNAIPIHYGGKIEPYLNGKRMISCNFNISKIMEFRSMKFKNRNEDREQWASDNFASDFQRCIDRIIEVWDSSGSIFVIAF